MRELVAENKHEKKIVHMEREKRNGTVQTESKNHKKENEGRYTLRKINKETRDYYNRDID